MINLQQIREFSTMEIHEFLFPIFSPKLKIKIVKFFKLNTIVISLYFFINYLY